VSASRVRSALAEGDFAKAKALLGRPFTIGGCVACGKRLGRSLGIPTANIRLGRRAAPVAGVFAVRVHGVGRAARPGVANLGVRPTVTGSGEPLLETFLFDFDGDLYGQRLEVEFVVKLRDEAKFTGLAALKAQMERDVACARAVLDTASGRSP
jgi:riboflavin kinase/FMN adenylyltransferase